MPTDRVLIEIVTAANMAGIQQAQAGMLGMNATLLGLTALLGIAVFTGKAAVENYKKQETASNELTQAYATQKDTLAAHKTEIEGFIETNKRYIANQYDTETALASLVRAGHNQTDAMRMLNDALDWSVIKHQNVSDSAMTLIKVLAGNQKALRELGITTDQYHAIMKSAMTTEDKQAALLALVESKTKDGRKTTDEMTGSQQALNVEWEKFSAHLGPSVTKGISDMEKSMANALPTVMSWLDAIGAASDALTAFENSTIAWAHSGGGSGPATRVRGPKGYASGGVVGGDYMGQPQLAVVHTGETVIPSGGGGSGTQIHIHIGSFYSDGPGLDRLTMAIANRLSFATGR